MVGMVHMTFITYETWNLYAMAHTLHMQGDIALNGCECMVGKSTLCLVFDWVGSVNGTTFNRVTRLIKMVKKICVEY